MRVSSLKAVAVSAAVVLLTVQCGGKKASGAAGGISPLSADAAATDRVEISQYKFVPETIHVHVGAVVKWTNHDDVGHTVSFTSADTARVLRSRSDMFQPTRPSDLFGSKLFAKDQSFVARFDKPGRFHYICEPHPYMKATVVVE